MSDSRNSRGGAVATRGLLVQTLAALLDITHGDNAFSEITLEPLEGNDKFDFLWKNKRSSHAKQVKSTENSFTKPDVERWAKELKEQRSDENCSLVLIGNIPPALAGIAPIEGVVIETKNLDLPAFIEQAAQRLAKFLERENLSAGTGEQRETVVHALESKLQHYAAEAHTLTRPDFVRLLRTWIGSVPKTSIAVDISSIVKHAPADLIGREDEMKLLHEAWAKVQSQENGRARVLTFVALGGEGKTSLVAKWAAELADQGWPGCDAVFAWSFYSQGMRESASSDLFLKEGLTFFGDTETANSSKGAYDKGRRLAQLVGEQRALLILDGVEPLQYAPTSPTPGELKDQGIATLLKALSSSNHGLCVVTTRYEIRDLRNFWQTTAPQQKLPRLSKSAGVALLKLLGVNGIQQEFETLVEDVKGHALTLNLLGSYICDAFAGDIRKRDLVNLEEADAEEQGGHAFRVIEAYVHWFQQEGDKGHRAVAILRCLGLFDRPVTTDCLAALQKAPAISGMTKAIVGISAEQMSLTLTRLEKAKLLSVNRDESGELLSLDTHPLLREYFAQDRQTQHSEAWRSSNQRLYEHLVATTRDEINPKLEDLQPLYQAIVHGCQAGLHQEAYDKVYFSRICLGHMGYSIKKLGAFGSDLGAISSFFEEPWTKCFSGASNLLQGSLLNTAAYCLRSLGRLSDAVTPMRLAVKITAKEEDWENAAVCAGNLNDLELSLGRIQDALKSANDALTYARKSGSINATARQYGKLAGALLHSGDCTTALKWFKETELLQAKVDRHTLLYSQRGYFFCELLLKECEREAWRKLLGLPMLSDNLDHREIILNIKNRSTQLSQWHSEKSFLWPLDIAFNQISLGRASLYLSIIEGEVPSETGAVINASVEAFRDVSSQDWMPTVLLTRALKRMCIGDHCGSKVDIDESWEIAARGPMPLFMADIQLHRARLFFREAKYPWESPQHDLAEAKRLIFKHGYLRRKQELEDAEAVVLHKT